ncbi:MULTISPECIES: caspase, EACC1-associated type [Pseudanabaena]|uniref:caspase, EACC1-associated type n=1 Tax=Pseudanabaena TaxID=1152 RepID=UPI00247A37A2|nr:MULTISPECIES: SUMF1/EgtB/PvdO family nonheme iron enzyme [Pseudanabaena]MEA5487509.1 SUMF1/EgtB/PvdO family nonheme iron enzyme [Pseudanabaena sp. CCNP1317]WGS74015.1 SUMF1/EgtB/PvdO family nonheme iron enzyme [Pseudanabaena galeata CCNP1313]
MAKKALLIGVSQYEAGLPPLAAAPKDVAAMLRVLQSPELGAFDEVKTLIDPDLEAMQTAIDRLFQSCQKGDLGLLYFSGHGITDDSDRLYLATRRTGKDTFRSTAVSASFIQGIMRDRGYQRQHVLILDCCYSGAFAEGWLAKSADINLKPQLEVEGSVVLTSSTSTQKSYEDKEGELSLYTNYIVQGIESGAAESDGDGMISADELHEYAKRHVQSAKPAMKPEIYGIRQGIKIRLARARVDAKLEYRRLVERYAENGEISFVGQDILEVQRERWGLSDEVAIAIENEVLEPDRKRLKNLARYQKSLERVVKQGLPLSNKILGQLKDLQDILGLRDEDVISIHQRFITVAVEPSPQTPAVAKSFVVKDEPVIVTPKQPDPILKFEIGNGINLEMVYIPSGKFMMGSPPEENGYEDERPQIKDVNVAAFYMGKYEVTQAQWQAIMGNNPAKFKNNLQNPVESVSWDDAQEFCKKLSQKTEREFRLPSEAEWEYACRAGTTTRYYFGEDEKELGGYGWFGNNSGKQPLDTDRIWQEVQQDATKYLEVLSKNECQTHPVGQKKPNAWGLYDMHGNVWEWCQDSYEKYGGESDLIRKTGKAIVKENDNRSRLLRGGSWNTSAQGCRSAYRYYFYARVQRSNVGFRVVCVLR